jgi:hypothetical protein
LSAASRSGPPREGRRLGEVAAPQALALEGRLEQRLALAFERAQATELENWETIAARLEANEAWVALDLKANG